MGLERPFSLLNVVASKSAMLKDVVVGVVVEVEAGKEEDVARLEGEVVNFTRGGVILIFFPGDFLLDRLDNGDFFL